MSNVRPGDLAYVVRHPFTSTEALIDRLVIVDRLVVADERFTSFNGRVTLSFEPYSGSLWVCRPAAGVSLPWTVQSARGVTRVEEFAERPIADVILRPIRDPGDDAVDEMVRIAGKPAKLVFDPSVPQRETETS